MHSPTPCLAELNAQASELLQDAYGRGYSNGYQAGLKVFTQDSGAAVHSVRQKQQARFLASLARTLFNVRTGGSRYGHYDLFVDALSQISLAGSLEVVTSAQSDALTELLHSASLYAGRPLPCPENAGPCISAWELLRRNLA